MAAERKQDGSIDLTLSDDELPPTQPIHDSQPMDDDDLKGSPVSSDLKSSSSAEEDDLEEEGQDFAEGSFR